MPLGWRTEDGPRPQYREQYGMSEHHLRSYQARTLANVAAADMVLVVAVQMLSRGTRLTLDAASGKLSLPRRPLFYVRVVSLGASRFDVHEDAIHAAACRVLDVAAWYGRPIRLMAGGNRASTCGAGFEGYVEALVTTILSGC